VFDYPVFTIIGVLIAVGVSLFMLRRFTNSRHWQLTTGKIAAISVDEIPLQQTSSSRSMDYRINVSYHYSVAQIPIKGDRLMAGFPNVVGSRKDADDYLQRLKVGAEVDVYYNPDKVNQSALNTSKGIAVSAIYIMLAFVLTIGGGMIWLANSGLLD